jgi:hypothetical protein
VRRYCRACDGGHIGRLTYPGTACLIHGAITKVPGDTDLHRRLTPSSGQ